MNLDILFFSFYISLFSASSGEIIMLWLNLWSLVTIIDLLFLCYCAPDLEKLVGLAFGLISPCGWVMKVFASCPSF